MAKFQTAQHILKLAQEQGAEFPDKTFEFALNHAYQKAVEFLDVYPEDSLEVGDTLVSGDDAEDAIIGLIMGGFIGGWHRAKIAEEIDKSSKLHQY